MIYRILLLLTGLFLQWHSMAQVYQVREGKIEFHSEAPQELIYASSTAMKGIIDITRSIFAFRVKIATFNGFNSPLQKEHFNENYMETSRFPEASFSGKIIENVDLRKDGDYTVRAKGKLKIHGVEQERIIYSKVKVRGSQISITSQFVVPLPDHNIKIPRLVYGKLAEEIKVNLSALLGVQQ
jgi:hypothetical protein